MAAVPGAEGFGSTAQAILAAGGFIIATAVYFLAAWRKADVVTSKDVVVPNVNVMDGAILRQAAEQLRASMHGEETRAQMVREMARMQREHIDLVHVLVAVNRRQVELLEGIDRRLRDEHQLQGEARERYERRARSAARISRDEWETPEGPDEA